MIQRAYLSEPESVAIFDIGLDRLARLDTCGPELHGRAHGFDGYVRVYRAVLHVQFVLEFVGPIHETSSNKQ